MVLPTKSVSFVKHVVMMCICLMMATYVQTTQAGESSNKILDEPVSGKLFPSDLQNKAAEERFVCDKGGITEVACFLSCKVQNCGTGGCNAKKNCLCSRCATGSGMFLNFNVGK